LIYKNIREYGLNSFKLSIYIIDKKDVDKNTIKGITLCLEQYFIFTLNPILNSIKVAGSNPINEVTIDHKNKIRQANSKPIWVYYNNTIIYKASSSVNLAKEIGIKQSTITNSLKNPEKFIFNKFKFKRLSEQEIDENFGTKLLDAKTVIKLINKNISIGKRTNTRVDMKLINHINNKTYTFPTSESARRFLILKGLRMSSKTLLRYRDTGIQYKGWSFYTNKIT
jgi:hypothetical protein